MIPNLSEPGAREAWARLEAAKRRVIYSLIGAGAADRGASPTSNPGGLAFDFMQDEGEDRRCGPATATA